jgi:hypothetical protein
MDRKTGQTEIFQCLFKIKNIARTNNQTRRAIRGKRETDKNGMKGEKRYVREKREGREERAKKEIGRDAKRRKRKEERKRERKEKRERKRMEGNGSEV